VDPLSRLLTSSLTGTQGVGLPQALPVADGALLRSLLGQDLLVFLQEATPQGVKLALPSGQLLTAQGDLPFPAGTQLRVRVQETPEGGLRLRTLEATPPMPAPILAPLLQGEAASLLARLAQPDPDPALAPLVDLFFRLGGTAPEAPPPALLPGQAPVPAALPPQLQASLAEAVQSLPPEVAAILNQELGLPEAAARDRTLQELQTLLTREGALPRGGGDLGKILERLLTTPQGESLLPLLQKALPGGARLASAAARREGAPAAAPEAPPGVARLPQAPETWESWIRGSLKALVDPAVSPREAPFHAAQAQEGTAFFEIPLPWAPGSPLQLWVESDGEGRQGGKGAEEQRVLLGFSFTRLGETRLGLAKRQGALQVRVWAEHPQALEEEREALVAELAAQGSPVDLRIFTLTGPVPSLKALAVGTRLEALG
jgi:hypothetical protein